MENCKNSTQDFKLINGINLNEGKIVDDKILSTFPKDLIKDFNRIIPLIQLIQKVDVDEYLFSRFDGYGIWNIVGLKNALPFYIARYDEKNGTIFDEGTLEILADGIRKGSKICKEGDRIIVIEKNGEITLATTGKTCYKKKVDNIEGGKKWVYIVEDDDNYINVFTKSGVQCL